MFIFLTIYISGIFHNKSVQPQDKVNVNRKNSNLPFFIIPTGRGKQLEVSRRCHNIASQHRSDLSVSAFRHGPT